MSRSLSGVSHLLHNHIEQCLDFESELYKYFDVHHKDLLQAIRSPEGLTDTLKAALSKALDEAKEQFKATRVAATG